MKRLGEILVGAKALTPEARDRVLREKGRGRFGTALLECGAVSEEILLRALSVQTQAPPATARDLAEIRPDLLRLVPGKLAGRLCVLPFRRAGRNLYLAMRDPKDLPAVDEIAFLTGLAITPHVALEVRLQASLEKHYGLAADARLKTLAIRLDQMAAAAPSAPVPPPPGPETARSAPAPSAQKATSSRPVPQAPPPSAPPRPPVPPAAITYRFDAVDLPAPLPQPPPPPPQRTTPSGEFPALFRGSSDPWGGTDSAASFERPPIVVEETFQPARPAKAPPAPPAPAAPSAPPAPSASADEPDKIRTGVVSLPDVAPTTTASIAAEEAAEEEGEAEEFTPAPQDFVSRLSAAESRDEIAEAVLGAASERVKRAGLFIVQADRVIGWAAKPEPPDGLRSFSLPFREASVFATLRNTEAFYAGPCPDLPANRKTLAALGASFPTSIGVVPVTLRGKSVLFLFAEVEGAAPVAELKRLATMTATALEIVLLRNRLRNL